MLLAVLAAVVVVLLLSLRSIAGLYTDRLWFDSLGFVSVWEEIFVTRIVLGLVFVATMFALVLINLAIAERLAPPYRPAGPEEELVRRYHELVGHRSGLVRLGAAFLFSLLWGITASGHWQEWILFRNRVSFGTKDAQFGRDVSFYVFTLPWAQFLVEWLFTAFVLTFVLTAVAHYLNGGIRINAVRQRTTPQVKAHLSVLLGVLAVIKAVDYWFDRFALTLSRRGRVDGANVTEVKAHLPALNLLILISVCAAMLLVVNIWRRGWALPAIAVGLWAFVAVVMGGVVPLVYQRFFVEPSESTRELPFIDRNITATRQAYGMIEDGDGAIIERRRFPDPAPANDLSPQLIADAAGTIANLRLLDPDIVRATFERDQGDAAYYAFRDLDVDRYSIDGITRPVLISPRQLDLSKIPGGTWEGRHLGFTHGYGLAVAPAADVVDGRPRFVVENIPMQIDSARFPERVSQPRTYLGEGVGGYAIVNTGREEIDYPTDEGQQAEYAYTGPDGVRMGGFFRQLAFAIRFSDINPLFSGLVDSDSRVIFNRDVRLRVEELAPFLAFDGDPYPVIDGERIVWVLDAYTTTAQYPNAQHGDRGGLSPGSGLQRDFNYVRNSVKATVDAYTGEVHFYVVDAADPLVRAWRKAFPQLFSDVDEIPDSLVDNLRYPTDLFTVQTNLWGRYHLGEPAAFFDPAQAWTVALDPGRKLTSAGAGAAPDRQNVAPAVGADVLASLDQIVPQHVLIQLPGEPEPEFVIMRPFVPAGDANRRQELTAFMVARSDPEHYGEILVYEVPGRNVDGPVNANNKMLSADLVATQTTLLGDRGSQVDLGNMLLVPVGQNVLWVRPLYVSASSSNDNELGEPEVNRVLVTYGSEVRACPTLDLSLAALFVDESTLENDDACRTLEREPPDDDAEAAPVVDEGEPGADAARLVNRALRALRQADEALLEGDLGLYQDLVDQAERLLAQADELLRG